MHVLGLHVYYFEDYEYLQESVRVILGIAEFHFIY